MLSTARIEKIARDIANDQVRQGGLERVHSESTMDSEGKEALRIMLVLTEKAAEDLTGDQALDLLTGIQRKLEEEGEERFPILEYATEQELQHDNEDEA